MTQDKWAARGEGEHRIPAGPEISDDLFDRYLAGEASANERVEVERMLKSAPDDAAVARLIAMWKEKHHPFTADEGRARVARRIGSSPRVKPTREYPVLPNQWKAGRARTKALWSGVWLGVFSALIVCLAFFARHGEETRAVGSHVYVTRASQQGVVNLDDGTRITLAPQTRLRVFPFGTQRRTVLESGEAYFDVTHALGAPFVVQSGATTTQALGTGFLIRYTPGGAPGSAHVRVSVDNGKVRVTSRQGGSGVTLTQGQVGEVTDSITHVNTIDEISPGTEWTPGLVIFRDTPLSKVLQTISQWYGYQFRYADQTLGARTVTIGISTRSSTEALAAIEQVLLVNLAVVGDTVTLVPHPSVSSHGVPRVRSYDVWSPTREVGR